MKRNKRSREKKAGQVSFGAGARVAFLCLGIGLSVVLLFSCLSFAIGDWPSPYVQPYNDPPANWCGSVGAFAAYYLLYYIGPGAFIILLSAICYCVAKLARWCVGQTVFRVIGMILLTVAASCTFHSFWPHKVYPFPMGSGGILGVSATAFLREKFATLGTFILVLATWVVGMALLADSLIVGALAMGGIAVRRVVGVVIPALAVAKENGEALSDIWQRLSARQKRLTLGSRDTLQRPAVGKTVEYATPVTDDEPVDEPVQEEAQVAEAEPESTLPQRPAVMEVKRPPEKREPSAFVQPSYDDYTLPPLELLAEGEFGYAALQEKVVKAKAADLEKLLSEFNINARVVASETGPVVTMFELELAAGVKVSQISTLANDIARALGAGAVRVVAPIPGKHTIGIEVPNSEKEKVRMKSMMQLAGDKPARMEIPLFLGKDSSGEALVSDLTKMPHLLIAGTTGSGKSVCINTIIVGILMTKRPDEVKMILIDPKMVEMAGFNSVPHLMCPIVTETQMAVQILEWATVKMDERYALLAEARVKNISEFNKLGTEEIIARFNPSTPDE